MKLSVPVAVLALLSGCSTNPVTGRGQIVELPAVRAHAAIVFELSSGARYIAGAEACREYCREENPLFNAQVKRIGAELEAAVRGMSPELFGRIDAFRISVDPDLGATTGSSADGRVVLGSALARLASEDDVTAFLIAREMAHIIARHDEEDSGARVFFSIITALIPGAAIARFAISALGSSALVHSWAEKQRREADEIALALLERTGRPAARIAAALTGATRENPPPGSEWSARYVESLERVGLLARLPPHLAATGE